MNCCILHGHLPSYTKTSTEEASYLKAKFVIPYLLPTDAILVLISTIVFNTERRDRQSMG